MSWADPWMLVALSLPAAAAWWVGRTRGGSKPLWPAISRVSISPNGTVRTAGPRKSQPAYLILLAVALGIIALARPQWGQRSEPSFSDSIELVMALDLSRSMSAQDTPNQTTRLRAAKGTIERLLDGLRGENVGLVVFAGTAFVQVPMSPDYQVIREFLPSLDPNYMPVGGSDYDRMLGGALEGFSRGNDRDRYLIVLSDGEATQPALQPRITALLRRNVHVIGIGFGTERGAPIPGRPVVSRLTPATLLDLATRTNGLYAAATTLPNALAVSKLIKQSIESGRAGRVRAESTAVGAERFQWFLAPAVLLSLLSLACELRRHPRPWPVRRIKPTDGTTTATPIAAAIVGVLATLVFVATPPPLQAHQDSEAGFNLRETFPGDPAQRVRAIASHMGKLGYDPLDLQLLVQAAIQFAISERAHGRLPLRGVMHDAVDAVHVGKKLAPQEAPWDQYETRIHELLAPLPVEAQAKEPRNNNQNDDDDDEQNYRPAPLRKAKDKDGKDLFGKNTESRSEFALGDLSGDETFAPQEPHGGRRRPPKPPQSSIPIPGRPPMDDPTLIEARKNFATVVKADSPGRVHHLLNGEGKHAVEQDW